MFQIVASLQNDKFGQFVALGILVWFGLHIFINIGMNIGIAPITGIPLLLVSYGGTAMVVAFLALGILQSIYIHKE
jgi:rod shape determining protein RodA